MKTLKIIHMVTVSVIIVSLLMIIVASCTGSKTSSLTAADIISKASDKMQAASSFHFILDQTGGGTPIGMGMEMTKAEGDIIKPDKLKVTIIGTVSGMSLAVQMVTVGSTTMMTNPLSGKWEVPPSQFAVLSVFDPNTGIAAIIKGISALKKLDDAQAGGVTCYHISGNVTSDNLKSLTGSSVQGMTVSVELWIGQADFMVRSIKLTGKITDVEVAGIVRTLNITNFNQPITINVPQ
jgi:lipoprotein LprG